MVSNVFQIFGAMVNDFFDPKKGTKKGVLTTYHISKIHKMMMIGKGEE